MTLLPKVKLKAAVNFPATVLDGTGVDVVKSNGTYQFNLDYDDFAPPVNNVTDVEHQNVLLWNDITETYTLANTLNAIGTRDIISVKSFGAIGNGSADDTAAIQATIDYASTLISGGAVYFPAGNYSVTATLSVSSNGVWLVGASRDSVNLIRTTAFGPLISFATGTTAFLDGTGIEKMRLVDNGTDNSSGMMIDGELLTRFSASDLTMFGGASGILFKAVANATLTDIAMYMQTPAGSPTGRHGVWITKTVIPSAPITWGSNIYLHNVVVYGGDNVSATYSNLEACLFVECVDGLWISSCYFGGANTADVQFNNTTVGATCGNIYAVNNMLDICRGYGLLINGSQPVHRVMFDGSISCSNVGQPLRDGVNITGPADDISIHGVVEGWSAIGVHLAASGGTVCTDISVANSLITNNDVGVQVDLNAGTNRVIVTGNNLIGNTTSALVDSSASTTIKAIEGNLGYSSPWLTYTPTVTPSAGSITTPATGRYKHIGSTVAFDVEIGPVSADTGTSYLQVTLPSPPGNPIVSHACAATENTTNAACTARTTASVNYIVLLKYDGTYPSAVGRRFTISGTYQV